MINKMYLNSFLINLNILILFVATSYIYRCYTQNSQTKSIDRRLPLVINTWSFTQATQSGWDTLVNKKGSVLDAVEVGCSTCEQLQCDGSVGYGSHPNEQNHVTLDAMIFDGKTQKVGAVANLYNIKHAISVARKVLEHTQHTLLVGLDATKFALNFDFKQQNLETNNSKIQYLNWVANNCQPNFWLNVDPDPKTQCGPYKTENQILTLNENRITGDELNHDTIGMIAIDKNHQIGVGTSTNGQIYRIAGRVGDTAIPGAGGYADNEYGAAVSTGDGDIIMRFSPAFNAVNYLSQSKTPSEAARLALEPVYRKFPKNMAAIVVVNKNGDFGAACFGIDQFPFSFRNALCSKVEIKKVDCFSN